LLSLGGFTYFDEVDTDGDGISNLEERNTCQLPFALNIAGIITPCLSVGKADSDFDGVADGVEVSYGTNPLVRNSNRGDISSLSAGFNRMRPANIDDGLLDNNEDGLPDYIH